MAHRTERRGNSFYTTFDNGCWIEVGQVKELAGGDFSGQLGIYNGDVPLLSAVTLNLCKPLERMNVVRSINGQAKNIPLAGMLNDVCGDVISSMRRMAPIQIISSKDAAPQERFLLKPFLPVGEPTLLFGRGGSGKSYLALLMAMAVQMPWLGNPLGWTTGSKPVKVLYLDWETDNPVIHRRIHRLIRGMSLPQIDLLYMPCRSPLHSEAEALAMEIKQREIGLVVVDSAGRAVGDTLNDPGPVNALFNALRTLGTTSLIIHHQAKSDMVKEKTPFGSQYFEANARSVWHIEREREGNDEEFSLLIRNTKINDGPKQAPIALKMTFNNASGQESTSFSLADLKQTEFAELIPAQEKILDALLEHGPMSPKEISDVTGLPVSTISPCLTRGKDKVFVQLGKGKWAAKSD